MAVALLALFVTYAYDARAGEVVSDLTNEVFTSGTSVERLAVGSFDPAQSDEGDPQGPYFWSAEDSTFELGRVLAYEPGSAYDYAAHGLTRNPFFAEVGEGTTNRYLTVNSEEVVHRAIFSRLGLAEPFSNVVVRTGLRESIYCDLLTQLTPGEVAPVLDESARLAVWVRIRDEDDSSVSTNLMVTAGRFANGFRAVTRRDYRLDLADAFPEGFDPRTWYRLTIRAHGDVSQQGVGLAAFSIYIDGRPVCGLAADYEICDPEDARRSPFLPEARALQAERRLFPTMSVPGSDKAYTISGLSFVGDCRVDDVSFSSADPGYGRPEAVFTLNWDVGFTDPLSYSLDGGVTTNALPVAAVSRDILIGSAPTNGLTLKVTESAYKTDVGYRKGVWSGANGAVLTNETATTAEFVYDGTNRNPIAYLASTRDVISVGPGGYDTFKSAFAALDRSTNALKVLELSSDVLVSLGRDAYRNSDNGYVFAGNGAGEYVLDLKGRTLRGQVGKRPTLVVSCKSLRIVDSSFEKTGRIQPVDSYLNPTALLNTAVLVYPGPNATSDGYVEPEVTLEAGIYDGWVRNDGRVDGTNAVTGVVFVEGGSYISTNGTTFYLEHCVTNPSAQFAFRSGYWSCLTTNAVIWTGLGDGLRWTDPDNWKTHAVPGPNDTALFPSRAEPWTVDVGQNAMTTTNLWLEGDVVLSGTNDFRYVDMRDDCPGRFLGDATLVFDGDQPGRLTETTLHPDWAGTVLVRNVGYPTTTTPKTLRDMDTWGTAHSTVVFNGVRGYVMDTKSYTMPYGFVLRDDVRTDGSGNVVTNFAWQNDSGYTGSTLTFLGALSGDGTFRTGKNRLAILQLFKFANVTNFHGRFSVEGKRVLIGSETVMSSATGLIAFGDHAFVPSGLGWTCRYSVFGANLHVLGETNDVLVTCTASEPDVSGCAITLNLTPGIAWLACTNDPPWTVYISGVPPPVSPEAGAPEPLAPSASASVFATASSLANDTGYAAAAVRPAAYALAVAAVQTADVSIDVSADAVSVVVDNAAAGLWYGIRHRASLSDEWGAPFAWRKADGSTVSLTCAREAEAGFYEVVVSYVDPLTAGGGSNE